MSRDASDGDVSVEYDPESETFRVEYDVAAVNPSRAVVEAIADIRETTPAQLLPLYEAIDPDVLDQFCMRNARGRYDGDPVVAFTYVDHRVIVGNDGAIAVLPSDDGESGVGRGLGNGPSNGSDPRG